MKHHYKYLGLFAATLGLTLTAFLLHTGKAAAFSSYSNAATSNVGPTFQSGRYNGAADDQSPAGTTVTPFYMVGKGSGFPYDHMEVYLYVRDTSAVTVTVMNAQPECNNYTSAGVTGPDYGPVGMNYSVSDTAAILDQFPTNTGCGDNLTLNIPAGASPFVTTVPGFVGFYILRAQITGSGTGENSFRFSSSAGQLALGPNTTTGMGFRASPPAFASGGSGNVNNGNLYNLEVMFAPVTNGPCIPAGTTTVPSGDLGWQDADANQVSWNTAIAFYLDRQPITDPITSNSWARWNGHAVPYATLLANPNGSFGISNQLDVNYRYRFVAVNVGVRNTLKLTFGNSIRQIDAGTSKPPCPTPPKDDETCSFGVGQPGFATPPAQVTFNSPAYTFNVRNLNTGSSTWTGGNGYALWRQRSDNGVGRPFQQIGLAGDPVNANETSVNTVSIGPINAGNSFAVGGTYRFEYFMMHSGTQFGAHCVIQFQVIAQPAIGASCGDTNITLETGYAATNFRIDVINTGSTTWQNSARPHPPNPSKFRLRTVNSAQNGYFYKFSNDVQYDPPIPLQYWILHGPVPFASWTDFEIGLIAGLPQGFYQFGFIMNQDGADFGPVCNLNVTVKQPKPSAAAIWAADCRQLYGTVHFTNPVTIPPNSGPAFNFFQNGTFIGATTPTFFVTSSSDGLTPGGGAAVQDYYFRNDPFNPGPPGNPGGGGVGVRLWPHYSYTVQMFWYSGDDNTYTPMSGQVPLNGGAPCLTASCSPVTNGQPEAGEPQDLGALGVTYINYTTQQYGAYTTTVSWNDPPLRLTDTNTGVRHTPNFTQTPLQNFNPPPWVGGATNVPLFSGMDPVTVTTASYGNIHAEGRFNGASAEVVAACDIPILTFTKPYLKAYLGDVNAGGGFNNGTGSNNCSPATSNIKAFANSDPGNIGKRVGSSADFGVYLNGLILSSAAARHGFYSGGIPPGAYPGTTNPLTFANTGTPPSPDWGGSYTSPPNCIFDYYSALSQQITSWASPVSVPIDNNDVLNGYTVGAGTVLSIDGEPNIQNHPTYVVNGDVYLTQDLIAWSSWNWSNVGDQPPLFTLVVKGNIYIDKNVRTLEGLFVAQPTGAPGTGQIYTCSVDPGPLVPTTTTVVSDCSNNLDVNGSFVAQKVHYDRIPGTLHNAIAQPQETYSSPFRGAAEKFGFTPEMLMSSPTSLAPGGGSTTPVRVDALVSLPPIF